MKYHIHEQYHYFVHEVVDDKYHQIHQYANLEDVLKHNNESTLRE
jgi:hypothetical protein